MTRTPEKNRKVDHDRRGASWRWSTPSWKRFEPDHPISSGRSMSTLPGSHRKTPRALDRSRRTAFRRRIDEKQRKMSWGLAARRCVVPNVVVDTYAFIGIWLVIAESQQPRRRSSTARRLPESQSTCLRLAWSSWPTLSSKRLPGVVGERLVQALNESESAFCLAPLDHAVADVWNLCRAAKCRIFRTGSFGRPQSRCGRPLIIREARVRPSQAETIWCGFLSIQSQRCR